MRLQEGLQALRPFFGRLSGAGGWLAVGLLLGVLTLIGSLGLLSLSGGFLTAAAIAGLTPATALAFNFFTPGAGVRSFAIMRTASRWGERVVSHEGTFRLLAALRVWLYRHLARLSPRQIGRFHGAETLNRLVRDIDALDNLYPRLILPTAAATIVFLLVTLMFAVVAPSLLWLPLLLLAMTLVVLPLLGWRLGSVLQPRLIRERATLRIHLLDCSEGLEDLSLHAPAWEQQRQRVLSTSAQWLQVQAGSGRRAATLRALVTMLVGLLAWLALGLLPEMAGSEPLSGPWIAALVLLLLGCSEALLPLANAALDLPGTAAAAQRIDAIAGQMPAQTFVDQGRQPVDASIEIRGLSFAWDAHTPVFSALNLDLAAGEHLCLQGASGCGKSTLIHLLTRFETPASGSIRIGGVDITELDETTLRKHVACAGQDAWAKTGTLADNLRLADPTVSEAQMRAVLEVVDLDPDKLGWQDGLNTWIEEGGTSLSGGQRRRLGIARALLRDAPIMLFDEPSEGLDPAAEALLISRLRAHLQGRTVLWISHRDGVETAFDRVLCLDS
ncbi:thiol reductant ABC exporter subunit CydC [Pseudothauera lacus]|uniref:Thiol reductant ABC exporter subunit CydC n=1 Tax=Pseudothauera lacus TaxID=2136175 RepID=A0A2T4IDC1_9RHOO|nr:thiol reductant ABC exporter subunit CydC [Pseudothauera lacus]PTD95771.1 thiol reductant ABC exporter subunit CydC [Pseudothauera lacus]